MQADTLASEGSPHNLIAVDMGVDTHQEPVVYMRADCHIATSEGFTASNRISLTCRDRSLIGTLNVVDNHVLPEGHVGLSKIAMKRLAVTPGDVIALAHPHVVDSMSGVRKKIFGHALNEREIREIITDISEYHYSDIEIASFLVASADNHLSVDEITSLTRAMVACGKQLHWPGVDRVFDKHCIGGLPGNRTTPILVSIASAAGLTIPKTSSRAITSPAGTADTMEALTNVELTMPDIQRVVQETGACIAWGGAVNLSPADDILIRIERALDIDGEGQLIASVLSKKIAAGSTHLIVDIPVGPTAKVRTINEADRLVSLFSQVAESCGLRLRCVLTDGTQPVGAGIGPVEEARDVLNVLHNSPEAPRDLRERSLLLAEHLLDLAQDCGLPAAREQAEDLLDSGRALVQFERIARAQGGLRTLGKAHYESPVAARESGWIEVIDNRMLSRLAKLAGAPFSAAAGLRLHVKVGDAIEAGEPLFTLYSETTGERDYALAYYEDDPTIFTITTL